MKIGTGTAFSISACLAPLRGLAHSSSLTNGTAPDTCCHSAIISSHSLNNHLIRCHVVEMDILTARERRYFPRPQGKRKEKPQPSFLTEIHLVDPLCALLLNAVGRTDSRFFERWSKESKIPWVPRSASPEAKLCPWTSCLMAQKEAAVSDMCYYVGQQETRVQWHLSQPCYVSLTKSLPISPLQDEGIGLRYPF